MSTTFEALKQKNSQTKTSSNAGNAFDALKQKSASAPVQETSEPEEKQGFVKSLVSAPLTMLGRPVQLAAELAGASPETVDKYTKKLTRGFVAPVPKSGADVKKDVGRAIETVALGASGPVSAGAALGFGASLEQGNDVFSKETAMQTAGGAVAGKVLSKVAPYAGKVVEKVTPTPVKTVFGRATKAVSDFAASKEILPKATSEAITRGANMAETIANKPFEVSGKVVKNVFSSSPEKIVQKRINTLQRLEDNNTRVGKYIKKQSEKGFDVKKDIAETDLLQGSVDNTGTIRTTDKGGALEQYQEFIKPKEGVVSEALRREGKTVPLKDVEKKLIRAIDQSGVKGASRAEALSKVSREIEGYKLELDKTGKKLIDEIDVPVSFIHDAKVDKYANVDYMKESGRVDKAIAKALKQIVENNTASADVAALNKELSRHYANMGFLERLNGTKVEGGRLGKHFARTIGAIAGSHFGPLGTIAGSELAGAIKGGSMSSTFGRKVGGQLTDSPLMKKTLEAHRFKKLPVKSLPSEYTNELPTIPFGKPAIPKIAGENLPVAEGAPKVFAPQSSKSFGNRNAIQPKVTSAKSSVIPKSIADQSPKVKLKKDEWLRYADDINKSTDDIRGGTWFTDDKGVDVIKDAMNPKNVKSVQIGGTKEFKKVIKPKNPLTVKNSILEDGSFSVINSGYESALPKQYASAAENLWKKVHMSDDVVDVDLEIMNALYDAGISEKQALKALNEGVKNKFDVAMDMIISKGLKQNGYDALILDSGAGKHILQFKKSNFGNRNAIQPKVTSAKSSVIPKSIADQSPKVNTNFYLPKTPEQQNVFDKSAKWVADWVSGRTTKAPNAEVEAYLSQFKPKKDVTVYRGGKDQPSKNLQSWSHNMRTAKEFGIESTVKGRQSLERKVKPDEILVDLSQLSMNSDVVDAMLKKISAKERNDILNFLASEGEVIIKPKSSNFGTKK